MNEIVSIQHRQAVTTSLKIAEIFGKKHKNVLQAIERLSTDIPERIWRLNFQPRDYTDERGKNWKTYEINRDGFTLLAMGFTGKKALAFKLQFIEAFNKMEQALLNQKNLSWQQQRGEGKTARRGETDCIARFVDYAARQGSTQPKMYYLSITKMTHKALFPDEQAVTSPRPFRDMLDDMRLAFLTTAEYIVQQALDEGMKAALYYKEIYTLARQRVEQYAAQLPRQRFLTAG
jgi:Rha family phage regulatory protein